MQWDRRTFVKFAVGSLMGIGASPLGIKFTDDIAIWTQNWSWVPDPEQGAVAFASTFNPDTGTGVRARMVKGRLSGERAIRVEGNPDHPLCQGGVIPADASALQLMYGDVYRVPASMIANPAISALGEVGAEEAVDYAAKKLAEIFKAGKNTSLAIWGADPESTSSQILMRFAAGFGTPNLSFSPSAKQTLALAGQLLFGQPGIGFDLANADMVVSFGTPLLENFGAPVITRKAFTAWQDKGAKLAQVESRASITASKADMWLACKPGTEGAVAMGLCNLLVASGAYDKSLVDDAVGFADLGDGPGFKTLVTRDYTPEKVAAITGVSPDKLNELAQAFVKAPKALAVCGPDAAGGPGRLFDFMAVLALNALRGNLSKTGGLVVRDSIPFKPLGDAMEMPDAQRLDFGDSNPLGVGSVYDLAQAGISGKPYPIEALILVGPNPAFAGPQAEVMKKFIESVPFVIAITPYLDESAQMADVVLPMGTFLECWGDAGSPYGAPVASYGLHRPLVSAVPEAAGAGDWILALAAKLGGPVADALPFESLEDAIKARTEDMGDFEELSNAGFWVQEKPSYGAMNMETASSSLELLPMALYASLKQKHPSQAQQEDALRGFGIKATGTTALMPHYEPPEALDMVGPDYPLLLAAVPSLRTSTSSQPISPYMIKVLPNSMLAHKDWLVVEINPETAHKLHLSEGEEVQITSEAGHIKAMVHLFAGAAPGVVYAPVGMGHTVFGMYLKNRGANFQEVARVQPDALSGQPEWSLTPVRVEKPKGASHV